ncbi:T9SS type A sorting domain-containing protein [Tenacibaculum sp. nBUS_03]|uniref:T9SS type A sorting domain-containing protein n=1 Tax=Tenacibaculum sp. nBUS_03 TaxID=3395320 RepID=UPI003EBEE33F
MKNQNNKWLSIVCFCVTIFFFQIGLSQNLVENPSFELGSIPNNQGQLQRATYWSHYKGECIPYNANNQTTFPSSDLFDKNSPSAQIKVPNNKFTTSAGLPERTGKNRYAGIYTSIYPPSPASEERIRGTLKNSLQAGGYDLSLYLARAKNFYAVSNPLLDPVNYYNVEVVLRSGNSCSQSKVIYTSPSITSFQWNEYKASFIITQGEANIFNKVEIRLKMWPIEKMGNDNARAILIDDVSISKVVCNLNPAFTKSITCNETSNTVSINVANSGVNPNGIAHQYEISEMSSFSTADADVVNVLGYVNALTGSYSVPNIGGKFYMIKHGVWTSNCSWREQRKVVKIPYSFNGGVNSNFSGVINSPSNGSPTLALNAAVPSNVLSNWFVLKSTVNTYPNLSSWSLHTIVNSSTPTHNYNVPNIQNGMFYFVRHISKTNCSQISYTDKIFFVYEIESEINKGKTKLNYNFISEKQYEVSERNHNQNMKKIGEMNLHVDKIQSIQLYPNPSREKVFLSSNFNLLGAEVEIINKYGKKVYKSRWKEDSFINVESLDKGVYIVMIKTLHNKVSKKLVIE